MMFLFHSDDPETDNKVFFLNQRVKRTASWPKLTVEDLDD